MRIRVLSYITSRDKNKNWRKVSRISLSIFWCHLQNAMAVTRLFGERSEANKKLGEGSGGPRSSDLKDAKSSILAISWHLFLSSVIITFYDLIFVISTLPGKREYFEIHLHKKCTKLTPEELKAIVLMSLVTLKTNSIQSWAKIYCWVKKTLKSKNSTIFYLLSALFSLMGLFDGSIKG